MYPSLRQGILLNYFCTDKMRDLKELVKTKEDEKQALKEMVKTKEAKLEQVLLKMKKSDSECVC